MGTLTLQSEKGLLVFIKQVADGYLAESSPAVQISAVKDAWSDEALVEAIVKRGSQRHFRTLMARYKTRVHRICLSILGPSQQTHAEDAAQEVFIRLYQSLDSFRGDCRFSTWLHRIAINCAIDFQRKNSRFAATDIDETVLPESLQSVAGSPKDHRFVARIQLAIRQLPQTQRMMVYQHYWLEMKIREIAEVLACPEGTVKVYLSRARLQLADLLGDLQDD